MKLQNFKVLVVDDHRLVRTLVLRALTSLQVTHIEEATNGVEAIEKLEAAQASGSPFHLVFLDWKMPGKDGLDVLTHCKKSPLLKDTPFIMLTAVREKDFELKARQAGALDYIFKPFEPLALVEKIESLFGKKAS